MYNKYIANVIFIIILIASYICKINGNNNNNVTEIVDTSKVVVKPNVVNTNNTTDQTYTFAKSNSFIRINTSQSWHLFKAREVVFHFRSDRPHGLLMYHTVVNPVQGFPVYELYVMLENGRLKIVHEFGAEQKFFFMGQGLNHDIYHTVRITINPLNGTLMAMLDKKASNHKNNGMKISLSSLASYVLKKSGTTADAIGSVLFFGGLDNRNPIAHQQYSVKRFVGCIGKIQFRAIASVNSLANNNNNNDLIDNNNNNSANNHLKPFVITNSNGLQKGCVNLCKQLDLCANSALCINHYQYTSCDCFGTRREDWHCRSDNISVLTLRGYSFVSYKVYNYKDRVHSDVNRISLHLKTQSLNGILVYARGEQPIHSYISMHLRNGVLLFSMDLGGGQINATIDNIVLSDDNWHNITVRHHAHDVYLYVDEIKVRSLKIPGHEHHLHVDPEIFIGGVPSARFQPTLIPFDINYRFVGCLKFVYFNTKSILYELSQQSNKAAVYHSVFQPEFGCRYIDPVPITMSTKFSHFIIGINNSSALKLSLEFKSEKNNAILASGSLSDGHNNQSSDKYWFLHLDDSEAKFTISSSNSSLISVWSITTSVKHLLNYWQQISLESDGNGKIMITSNYKYTKEAVVEGLSIEYFHSNVSFGAGFLVNSSASDGIRGCLRDITINRMSIDPRVIYDNYAVIGKISLDNCQLVDPCNSPNVCENGGKCIASIETGQTKCDCGRTGYVGKTCHFSIFKRTCEELYLAGYHKTGIYIIDIDQNGPLPPAHVICSMSENGMIETIVEHNIRHQLVVRERGKFGNFYLNVTYREFTPKMLHLLIMHSKQCSQYIKYECNSAPLGLSSYTWMQSTAGNKVTSIGSGISGRCKCSTAENCVDRSKHCNCDSETIGWKHDEGFFTNPKDVGITRMFFLQTKTHIKDSEAHLILGNVSCINSNTREYEITFQTKESYLEVLSGWEGGDLAVSFRTTAPKAVIFYQSPLHSHHGYFKAILSDEYEITFEFLVNNKPRSVKLVSSRRLNTGDWQQIWIDSDAHHMRFTVNLNSELFDLEDDDEFNTFEGPLYVGGAPKHLLLNSEVRTGFIGCLRGLVLNNKVINLNRHLHRKTTNMEKGCRPFCRPDLCKNGATCVELWGSYECKCANPVSQRGQHCENDSNANSMTFITPSSYYQKLAEGKEVNPILEKDITISFRTHMANALIFYANDYMNNFVQLHIENGTHVIFTFNTMDRVVRGAVKVDDILTAGIPIQIKIDRSDRSKTVLMANDAYVVIKHSIKFLTKYSQKPWKSGDEYELVKPARPPVPIEAHSQLFLGGVDEVGATSQIQGIVGCLQGFMVGGKLFDLISAAKEPSTVAIGQIRPGCTMMCDRIPCLNGGACTEDWKNNKVICNCSMTSYGGETCNKDVGARFNGRSLVRYTYEQNDSILKQVSIHLAFSTDKTPESTGRTLLVVKHLLSSTLIHITLMADHSLLIEEITNSSKFIGRVSISDEIIIADGSRHWLLYTRKDSIVQLVVDSEIYDTSYETKTTSAVSGESLQANDENLVIVGAIHQKLAQIYNFTNFIGCVSNVLIELNELKLEPLESAFGGRTDLSSVRVEGDIKQGLCAEFKEHIPVISSPVIELPEVNNIETENELWLSPPEPKLITFLTKPFVLKSSEQINKTPIYIVCSTFLAIVFIICFIYMWHLQRNYRIRQFQGETPFFHSHSKHSRNSSRNRDVKFHMISNGNNSDSEAAVKLLQHQELINGNSSPPQESFPLKEPKAVDFYAQKTSPRIRFIDQMSDQSQDINCDINQKELEQQESDQTLTSRVRFAD
ncbi:axotactin-like [Oppia nitens]|uniref:axotactin-like n=1 Tax=Oppia nitens TaxID=1686743 RepID=UPI0023DCAE0E|nr:axotactin-like [Oppia nitens]